MMKNGIMMEENDYKELFFSSLLFYINVMMILCDHAIIRLDLYSQIKYMFATKRTIPKQRTDLFLFHFIHLHSQLTDHHIDNNKYRYNKYRV